MPKVFISHSWEDNDIARRLAEQLKRDGAEIWIDYARILGGDSLPKKIGDAIEWCDTLILVWSASAKSSYWVNTEWETAMGLEKHIIPCILDGSILPVILRRLLYIPMQKFDEGYEQLVRSSNLKVQDTISPLAEKSIQIHPLSVEQPASPPKIEINGTGRNKVTPSMLFFPCFRQKPSILSNDDVEAMLKRLDFFDLRYNNAGKGFVNDYGLKTINRDKVVIDRASSLMWQQGGSEEYMTKAKADEWIKSLNVKGYAGYKNWRLPTLEEAMSLMEPELKNGDLFINSIFDEIQRWIWTSDNVKDGPGVWIVGFVSGSCGSDDRLSHGFVRAVRFRQTSVEQPLPHSDNSISTSPLNPVLRSAAMELSIDEMKAMLKRKDFYDSRYNKTGKGVVKNFEPHTIIEEKIVIDRASGLMWQRGGSLESMIQNGAAEWVKSLNTKGSADYRDWRLPTLEEAMSLMEPEKRGFLYIDPIFEQTQRGIWTSDNFRGESWVWVVLFDLGYCDSSYDFKYIKAGWVRAVRSIHSSAE